MVVEALVVVLLEAVEAAVVASLAEQRFVFLGVFLLAAYW